jgi:hypothetical protein
MPKLHRDGADLWWDVRGEPDAPPLILRTLMISMIHLLT